VFYWKHPCQTRWLFNSHLASLVSHFGESTCSKSLEELTIAFGPCRGTDWVDEVAEITSCPLWSDLDAILWRQCPDLERLQILFQPDLRYSMVDFLVHLQTIMYQRLPKLNERVVLAVGIASIEQVRDDAWSKAGY
jgi:hypothetical protein